MILIFVKMWILNHLMYLKNITLSLFVFKVNIYKLFNMYYTLN